MSNFKIRNEFGIMPSKNHTAAGWDFHIPNIKTDEEYIALYNSLPKSYNISIADLNELFEIINTEVTSVKLVALSKFDIINIAHLFLALRTSVITDSGYIIDQVHKFTKEYLIFDLNSLVWGIKCKTGNHLFINSGIRVALEPNTVGVFMNKSGRGNAGFSIRAQVIDEDYTGFVHLSVAYTRDDENIGKIYCGDKLVQLVILPVVQYDAIENLDEDSYNNIMKDSTRGDNGFGSSNEKH